MKKLFVFFIVFLFANVLFAQLPISLGIKGGFTSAKLTTDKSEIKDNLKNGFLAGAFIRLKGKKIYLQPEVYFAIKGGELKYDQTLVPNQPESSITQTVKLNTIDVPVMLGYKMIDTKLFNFRIHAGPVASFIVNKDFEFSINGEKQETDDDDISLKNAIWGLQLGAGVDVLMFTLDVRYELGLNNIYEKPENAGDEAMGEFKSNVFLVSLGWKIL
ncbi:MAG: PorT family protein [Bacteroidales bacterium]|nr:PorT family protein [Bacteroidales bacterium]